MVENKMDKLIALFKRRGFVYAGSEIYGGLANTYDYGPVGTELLRNIRNLWWTEFVTKRDDMVGIESSLISHHRIWEASGHVGGFADALVDCKNCKTRMRADHLIEDYLEENSVTLEEIDITELQLPEELTQEQVISYIQTKKVEGLRDEQLSAIIKLHAIPCPKCTEHDWTEVRKFNLLFPVSIGIVVGEQSTAYLRGETAQGMFVDFKNVLDSSRVKLPFGIAQIGKSFRNEITPGNSVFRTLVFEQAEIEYFFDPENEKWEELFEGWKQNMWNFVTGLGVKTENLRWREHADEERSFYSKRTEDLEYQYPFGFKELWGLAYRTDYDLGQHEKFSGKELRVVEPESGRKILPHVIEPAVGIDRIFLMILSDAYTEEDDRIVLKLHPKVAPYKVAVFPLLKNKPELIGKAREVYEMLQQRIHGKVVWDDRGNIGKRYLSQDEVGTPWCVTVDFDSLEDDSVTVRDRDTASQERIKIEDLAKYFLEKLQ